MRGRSLASASSSLRTAQAYFFASATRIGEPDRACNPIGD